MNRTGHLAAHAERQYGPGRIPLVNCRDRFFGQRSNRIQRSG